MIGVRTPDGSIADRLADWARATGRLLRRAATEVSRSLVESRERASPALARGGSIALSIAQRSCFGVAAGARATRRFLGRAARATLRLRLSVLQTALLVLLIGVVVEAALAFRLWVQVGAQDVAGSGQLAFLYGLTDALVAPFRGFEPEQPIRETAILEIATLVAMEAVLVATLAMFAFCLLAGWTVRCALARHRSAGKRAPRSQPRGPAQPVPQRARIVH